MTGRGDGRHPGAPTALKLALGVAVIALLVLALVMMSRLFLGALNLLRTDGGASQPDPQFEQPAETFAPPQELLEGEAAPVDAGDPSEGWVEEIQTPVDKTAEELSREAQGG